MSRTHLLFVLYPMAIRETVPANAGWRAPHHGKFDAPRRSISDVVPASAPGPIIPDAAVESCAVRSDFLRPSKAGGYGSRRGGRDDA
jgi:hypothetical protein